MRISDWSSDVCSSDLRAAQPLQPRQHAEGRQQPGAELALFQMAGLRVARGDQRRGEVEGEPVAALELLAEAASELGMAVEPRQLRSEEQTSELQSLMSISYAVLCLKKNNSQQSSVTLRHA